MGEAPRGNLPGPPADGTEIICGLQAQQPGPILGLSPPYSEQLHPHTTQGTPPSRRDGGKCRGNVLQQLSVPSFLAPPCQALQLVGGQCHTALACAWP